MIELIQKSFMKGKRRFVLSGDGSIRCEYRNGRSVYEYSVDLAKLDINPRQNYFFATSMLIGALILGIPAVTFLIRALLVTSSTETRIVCSFFSVMLSPFALLCVFGLYRQSYRLLVFTNPTNDQDSVALYVNKPDPLRFQSFVDELKQTIKNAHLSISPNIGIASEIRELVKLRDEGVLSEEEFLSAKTRVIRG